MSSGRALGSCWGRTSLSEVLPVCSLRRSPLRSPPVSGSAPGSGSVHAKLLLRRALRLKAVDLADVVAVAVHDSWHNVRRLVPGDARFGLERLM